MTYAERTSVAVDKSRADIEKALAKYNAKSFGYFAEPTRAIIVFEANDRRIRFDLPLPEGNKPKDEQTRRSRWRALLLCIKAKLEAVDSKIESFEEAFMAHVVMPDGDTVGSHLKPQIAEAYRTQSMVPLLPKPMGGGQKRIKATDD